MKKNWFAILAIGMAALVVGGVFAQNTATAPTALSVDARTAVLEALTGPHGEYAAYATYSAVLEKFGNIEPYRSIQTAEARHIQALERMLTRYGVAIPANPYLGKISLGTDLVKIASDEAQTEIDNVAMYDQLLPKVTAYTDITRVFTNLRAASQQNHLPAFQAAAKNGGKLETPWGMMNNQAGAGNGMGQGMRQQGQQGQGMGPGAGQGRMGGGCMGGGMGQGRGPRR